MTEPKISAAHLNVLAAELAFGLLDSGEKASALRREMEDPSFAAAVSVWRERTESWIDELSPTAVDELVWSRIQFAVGGANMSDDARTAGTRAKNFWHRFAMLASAACVALVLALVVTVASRQTVTGGRQSGPPIVLQSSETTVAQIADKAGSPLLSAVYHPRTGALSMRVSDLETSEKAPELWVLDKAGKPHSLGLVGAKGTLTIRISDRLRALLVQGATVAITVEDRASAPHDAPKGEILGTAKLSTI